jgi:hypothetical protein
LLADKDIDHLTWVFLDHGSENQLALDKEVLSVELFKGMFDSSRTGISRKSLVVIIDADHSAEYSQQVNVGELGPRRMCILASGPGACATSLVILSDDPNAERPIRY